MKHTKESPRQGRRIPEMRSHRLLACPRWAFHRKRLWGWLQSVCTPGTTTGVNHPPPPGGGISWWAREGVGYGSDSSWWHCDLIGQCRTSFSLSLVMVRLRRLEVGDQWDYSSGYWVKWWLSFPVHGGGFWLGSWLLLDLWVFFTIMSFIVR